MEAGSTELSGSSPHSLRSQSEPAEAVAGGGEDRCWENFWGPSELMTKRSVLWDGSDGVALGILTKPVPAILGWQITPPPHPPAPNGHEYS